jgi:tetratricopeptide (TPR) repeat protein
MRFAFALTIGVALLTGTAASAAVAVVGNGTAKVCYSEAEAGWNATFGIKMCNDALKNETLSQVDRASTLINRGILKARVDDIDGALSDYAEAMALGENVGEAYLNRSATEIALRHFDDAKADADQAIAHGTKRMEIAYYNRAVANEGLGNVGAAFQDYKAALQLEPGFTAARQQLARYRVTQKNSGT